jgi:transcription antitermination factor NusG
MNTSWRVLFVSSNREKRVSQHLTLRSVDHYLPLYEEQSQWTDRTVTLQRPLFPGYIFVRFAPEQKLSMLSVPGVIRLLETERTGFVADSEVGRIREALNQKHVMRPHPGVLAGTKVRIRHGLFAGAEGVVCPAGQGCNVVLSIPSFGQSFSLKVDPREIDCIADRETAHSIVNFAGEGFWNQYQPATVFAS